ncbi:Replication protein P, partial [Haemophilus influenzae]
YTNVITLS